MRNLFVASVVAVVLAGCTSGHATGGLRPDRSTSHSAVTTSGAAIPSAIVIDAAVHETFVPPPTGVLPKLSAEQAWQSSQRTAPAGRSARPLPRNLLPQLGVLTLPPQVTDVLAWGYRSGPTTCVYTGIYQPDPPRKCYMWQFVSATNGRSLDATEQELRIAHVTPTPIATQTLIQAGLIDGITSRFAPDEIEFQAPESVIRWTFDEDHCRIEEHWFQPVFDDTSPSGAPCRPHHQLSIDTVASLAGHGGDFEVVAGHQARRYGEYVRVTLANGTSGLYTQESDATWIFVIQRCGTDPTGTAVTRIDEVSAKGRHLIASRQVNSPAPTCPN